MMLSRVVAFAVLLTALPALAQFDMRHSLMRVGSQPVAGESEPLLLPELKQSDVSREGVVLKPLPVGKKYFTDVGHAEESQHPAFSKKDNMLGALDPESPRGVQGRARAHVVSFNTKEAAETALSGVASRYPQASSFGREAVREEVNGKWVWRGYFVGDKDKLGAFCKELSAAGEWCHVK